jgi:23S rRNA pseudouridine2605 synthase
MSLGRDTHITEGLPGERIAKTIARSGLCSRRDAERLIADGRVTLNGKKLDSPAINVGPDDTILVDGKPLSAAEPAKLWRYHKPKGRVTTHKDPEGRPTVFEALPEEMGRVISVGRLDFNTEGLLLLTNDGALARHLESPSTGWLRRYRVRVNGKVEQNVLDTLAKGVEIEGIRYGPIEAKLDRVQGANSWLTLGIREGKNREVRRIMDHLALTVNRLIRLSFGPFALGELEPGAVEEVKRRILADQLGEELAKDLGLREKRQNRGDSTAREESDAPARPRTGPARSFKGAPTGKLVVEKKVVRARKPRDR